MEGERRSARTVNVGGVVIGGDAPISVQSMTNTRTDDVSSTLRQIREIHNAGGELVRVAVPDRGAVSALTRITADSPIPVVADVHYRYELALDALEQNIAKLRINPGNIGGIDRLMQIVARARENSIPLRIGVNAASLEKGIREKYGGATPEALVESALNHIRVLERMDYFDVVISLKASDVPTTYRAYRFMAGKVDYPFHLGITEAGPPQRGTIKSAVGIGALLMEGIGDTVRVSLTSDPVEEINAARLILQFAGRRRFGAELVACPTCGRCEIDVIKLAAEVENIIENVEKPIKVAVMGCIVNGPGEARDADLGVSGSARKGVIFRHGQIIRRVPGEQLIEAFREELQKLCAETGIGGEKNQRNGHNSGFQ
ncbi:MAG: flavodoxin-dependent (E)-4-hydroxy-3-methylbut-2-enyl-diphosphate synthase [Firmicutes bacterium]|jgi:(E)-4-hydroxy-3-methylbut-2-enyl-diphosphate synthase|nr:flavodoxin-dependent (E)-4-hydroxy-3-methylbut-2-enyl-diphosphate synthase [Bacillota bacterium]